MSTNDQQVQEIVEGLGIGLLTLGVQRVASGKMNLELAFSHAWRAWPHAHAYPSIERAPKPDNLFWIGIQKSVRRRRPTVAWTSDADSYVIELVHEDWTPENAVDLISERPLDHWVLLADPFYSQLARNS